MRLNPVDISFLLGSKLDSFYDLPNSFVVSFKLKSQISLEKFQHAILLVDKKYPQFHLLTKLNTKNYEWEKLVDPELILKEIVTKVSGSWDDILNKEVQKQRYDFPLKVIISEENIFFNFSHAYSDALFGMKLLDLIFVAYENIELPDLQIERGLNKDILPQFDKHTILPDLAAEKISPNFPKPEFKSVPKSFLLNRLTISENVVDIMAKIREIIKLKSNEDMDISINTLMNILLVYEFAKKNLQNDFSLISIPTHLSRYDKENKIYPYNYIEILNFDIKTPKNLEEFITSTVDAQKKINEILNKKDLIQKLSQNIEEMESDRSRFIKNSKKNYIKSFNFTEQSFAMSYTRIEENEISTMLKYVDNKEFFYSAPIIGTQPLALHVARIGNKMNVSYIIDQSRMNIDTAQDILGIFEFDKILQFAEEIKNI